MAKEINKIVEDTRAEIKEKIEQLNKAVVEKKAMGTIMVLENELKELEKNFALARKKQVFEALSKEKNPIKAALLSRKFSVISHKRKTDDDGEVVGYTLIDEGSKKPKKLEFDLYDFCKFCGFDTKWNENIKYLNMILAVNVCKEVTTTNDSILMAEINKKIKNGETPASNTQIKKVLQECIDGILFEGETENSIQANNKDFAYIKLVYARRGKNELTIEVPKSSYVRALVCDVMQRIITNGVYTVDSDKALTLKKD